jgi:hypothetical protein
MIDVVCIMSCSSQTAGRGWDDLVDEDRFRIYGRWKSSLAHDWAVWGDPCEYEVLCKAEEYSKLFRYGDTS